MHAQSSEVFTITMRKVLHIINFSVLEHRAEKAENNSPFELQILILPRGGRKSLNQMGGSACLQLLETNLKGTVSKMIRKNIKSYTVYIRI